METSFTKILAAFVIIALFAALVLASLLGDGGRFPDNVPAQETRQAQVDHTIVIVTP